MVLCHDHQILFSQHHKWMSNFDGLVWETHYISTQQSRQYSAANLCQREIQCVFRRAHDYKNIMNNYICGKIYNNVNKPLVLNYVLPVTVRWWAITFVKMSVTSCIHSFIGCHGKAWNLVGLAYCQCKYPTKMKSSIGTCSKSLSSYLVNVFFNNHFINLTWRNSIINVTDFYLPAKATHGLHIHASLTDPK